MNQKNGDQSLLELDAATVNPVAHLAKTWGVTEEQAVRRALEQASIEANSKEVRLEAFKQLQRNLNLTSPKADQWQSDVREARR